VERSAREVGDRYVLQYTGGVERLARVHTGEEPLRPIESEHPLPPRGQLAGEWLLGPRDRAVLDECGRYWCVSSRAVPSHGLPRWTVRFQRFTAHGHALQVAAETRHEPAALSDGELVEILRCAWSAEDA
jgi:hypothetical protein